MLGYVVLHNGVATTFAPEARAARRARRGAAKITYLRPG
jgi:hypothetical protein